MFMFMANRSCSMPGKGITAESWSDVLLEVAESGEIISIIIITIFAAPLPHSL